MRRMRTLMSALLLAGLLNSAGFVSPVSACPMCKTANETQSELPKAYQFSILFMLAMPATIFTGIGFGLYKISQREAIVAENVDDLREGA